MGRGSVQRRRVAPSKPQPLVIKARYITEPLLAFAHGEHHEDPKTGISAYGPLMPDGRHPATIELGFIGTADSIATARAWILESAKGRKGTEEELDFPGTGKGRGFFSEIATNDAWNELLTATELEAVKKVRFLRDRFDAAVALLTDKLRLIQGRDHQPTCVVLALPDEPFKEIETVEVRSKSTTRTRDLRAAVKAKAMDLGLPTQILHEDTLDQARDEDHVSKKAWNLFTALYFKAGGIPWGPVGLPEGSCYIGVSFFRPYDHAPTVHTSVIQAFDETGESLILRGPDFSWDERTLGKSPHLTTETAKKLIRDVLEKYQAVMKRTPRRVVIHKTSGFLPDERKGFLEAVAGIERHDFVAMRKQHGTILFREGSRPVLRGTAFSVGDRDYLYTVGYVDSLKVYPAMHIPTPIEITDHVGHDTARDELLREILTLTKMNWNSARFGASLPITLRFSQAVSEILREKGEGELRPQFKFYR